jgi:hypothetical protein
LLTNHIGVYKSEFYSNFWQYSKISLKCVKKNANKDSAKMQILKTSQNILSFDVEEKYDELLVAQQKVNL